MQRWEYFTTTLEANVETSPAPVGDDIPPGPHGKYTPYSLIPQLNAIGNRGWELMSISPVAVGKNDDVVLPDANSYKWARHYFCCFKPPIEGD